MLRGIQWPQTSAAHSQGPASGASSCSSLSPSQLAEVVPSVLHPRLKCGSDSPWAGLAHSLLNTS